MFQEFKEPVLAPVVNKPKNYKEIWLEKLRSGEYKQGFGQYYDETNDEYCAIGILYCDVLQDDVICNLTWWMQAKVINLNDTHHETFAEIADWIEKNVPEF